MDTCKWNPSPTVRMVWIDPVECPSDILRMKGWLTIFGGTVMRGCKSWDRVSWDIAVTENRSVSVMCKVEMVLVILQHVILLIKKNPKKKF
jgi:hypothetical protein